MVVDQLAAGSWVFLFLWLVPDRLPPPRRAHPVAALAALDAAGAGRGRGVPGRGGGRRRRASARRTTAADPPLPWLPARSPASSASLGLLLTVLLFFGAAFAVRGHGCAGPRATARLQLLWLVWGATSLPLALVLAWIGALPARRQRRSSSTVALTLAGVALPVTIGIAILRYRLFDIRLVLSRTLTYGVLRRGRRRALRRCSCSAPTGSSATARPVACSRWRIVAVAVHPAYSWLRRRIERWVYGYRSDPAAALRRLGRQRGVGRPPARRSTRSPRRSPTRSRSTASGWSTRTANGRDQPARPGCRWSTAGERVGDLAVEVPPGRTLSAADTALLHDLARTRRSPCAPRSSPLSCRPRGRGSSPRGRRSASACAATCTTASGRPWPRSCSSSRPPSRAGTTPSATPCWPRSATRPRPRSPRYAGWSTTSVRPRSTRSASSGAIRQRAASLTTDELVFQVHGPGPAAAAARGRRGRGVPDRLGGDDQRGQALRRHPVPRRARAVTDEPSGSRCPTTAAAAAARPAAGSAGRR